MTRYVEVRQDNAGIVRSVRASQFTTRRVEVSPSQIWYGSLGKSRPVKIRRGKSSQGKSRQARQDALRPVRARFVSGWIDKVLQVSFGVDGRDRTGTG